MNAAIDLCAQTTPHQLRAETLEEFAARIARVPTPVSRLRKAKQNTRFDFWALATRLVLGPSREG